MPVGAPQGLSRVDTAYACFAWIAIVPWIEPLILLLTPVEAAQVIITLISLPLVLGAGGAQADRVQVNWT